MPDDLLLNKGAIIRRCLARVREEYAGNPAHLDNLTRQDAMVLNVQRACEAAIDLAMHVVARRQVGVPQTSREAFMLLEQAGLLTPETARRLRAMVGFRNVAVHAYQELQLPVLRAVIEEHLGDFETFLAEVQEAESGDNNNEATERRQP
ncbi:MAG: type VII toxin-antitoxin system HepT family RNase toxin [Verrucomicrobiota bacterium]